MAKWLQSRIHWLVARVWKSETASGTVIDVLDGGRLAELGVVPVAYEAAVIPGGDLTIDEETEPIGMRHLGCLGIVLQFDKRVRHCSEAEWRKRSTVG
jgi:hypothetical protein